MPQVQHLKTTSLKLHERNPRFIKDRQFEVLCESIRENPEFFEARPILCTPDGVVFAGNMRLRAAREIGLKTVPTVTMDIGPEKVRELMIRDNVQNGEWEPDVLSADFTPDELIKFGLEMPDFQVAKAEAQEDDYEIPDEIKTDIVAGDLFEIGRHRLLCDDCTDSDAVARLMGGVSVDLIVTDPPYGVSYVGKTKDALEIQNDSMTEEQTHELWRNSLSAVWPCVKPGGVIYATVPAGPLHIGFAQTLKDFEALRQIMVWNKGAFVLGHSDYHYKHEPILYGWKPGAAHYFTGDRTQDTVFDFPRPNANKEHPTMKPVELWAVFMQNSSVAGEVIYDPFLGSGTTMVAAHQLDRKCYGMEIDPKYCQVIVDRMLKLDPEIQIKRNGKPYQITGKEQV